MDNANYSRIESEKRLCLFFCSENYQRHEGLDKKDKIAFYAVLDAFIGKKKLKDALANVLIEVK